MIEILFSSNMETYPKFTPTLPSKSESFKIPVSVIENLECCKNSRHVGSQGHWPLNSGDILCLKVHILATFIKNIGHFGGSHMSANFITGRSIYQCKLEHKREQI